MKRRRLVLFLGLGLVLFLGFSVYAWAASPAKSPIKIGLLEPRSGPYARLGESTIKATKLAFEQAGDIAGRKVEIIVEDTEMKPDVGIIKAKKLIDYNNVHFIAGAFSSAVAMALRDYADANQVPYLMVSGSTLTRFNTDKRSRWCRHLSYSGAMSFAMLPDFLIKELGLKRLIYVGPDYVWGRDNGDYYRAAAEKAGGKVVQEIYTPWPTLDFSAYLPTLKINEADVVCPEYGDEGGIKFIKQYRRYGMKLLVSSGFPFGRLPELGLDAVGGYSCNIWIPGLQHKENIQFVKSYIKKYGSEPDYIDALSYASAQMIIGVLRKIKGDVENKTLFLDKFYEYEFQPIMTPLGETRYEKETEGPILPNYVFEVIEKGGKPTEKLVKTYKAIKTSDVLRTQGLIK